MKSVPVEKWALTGEQLHGWYLEAVKGLQPSSFNPNANKPYSEMTDEQKSIDSYIAGKINSALSKAIQAAVEEERKGIEEEMQDMKDSTHRLGMDGDRTEAYMAAADRVLSIINKP